MNERTAGQARKLAFFTEADFVEVVNARMAADADPRLREIVGVVVKHLHEAVKELRLTPEEWFKAIDFLTRTGQICTEWRQEYILLSDTLGVSMLVDAINHDRPEGSTENTVLGPFYVANSPRYENGANINLDGKGEPVLVSGRVVDQDGKPIAGALLEVWQANADGFYDVQQKGVQPDNNLRAAFTSDANGEFWFRRRSPSSIRSRRRPCRRNADGARPSVLSPGPSPFHGVGAGLRHDHHPHLYAGLSLSDQGSGVRRQGIADRRLQDDRRRGRSGEARVQGPVLVRELGLRHGAEVSLDRTVSVHRWPGVRTPPARLRSGVALCGRPPRRSHARLCSFGA